MLTVNIIKKLKYKIQFIMLQVLSKIFIFNLEVTFIISSDL